MSAFKVTVSFNEVNIISSAVDFASACLANAGWANELQTGIDELIKTSAKYMFAFHESGFQSSIV